MTIVIDKFILVFLTIIYKFSSVYLEKNDLSICSMQSNELLCKNCRYTCNNITHHEWQWKIRKLYNFSKKTRSRQYTSLAFDLCLIISFTIILMYFSSCFICNPSILFLERLFWNNITTFISYFIIQIFLFHPVLSIYS